MNHSLLTAHSVERIRDELREVSEQVRAAIFGTAMGALFAFANTAGFSTSSRARRSRARADRSSKRAAGAKVQTLRSRTAR